MPAYDYTCESCGHRFEAWQRITEDPIAICPACGGPVHRILYPVGIVFKGSGFYINDSRASANGSKAAESSGEAPAAEAKPAEAATAGSKAESKSEAKSDAKPTSAPAEAKPSKASAATASE